MPTGEISRILDYAGIGCDDVTEREIGECAAGLAVIEGLREASRHNGEELLHHLCADHPTAWFHEARGVSLFPGVCLVVGVHQDIGIEEDAQRL
jgi:hypothetical protein